jgi:murein DD-endopeptidase MepM/ murein hydrolase activator NlpD
VARVATALCALIAALVAAAAAGADVPVPCAAAGLVAVVEPGAPAAATSGPAVSTAVTAGVTAPSFTDTRYGVALTDAEAGAAGCVAGSVPGGTHAASGAWSVLDGAVSGTTLRADLVPAGGDGSGWHLRSRVVGLRVVGDPAEAIPGATIAVGDWGTLSVGAQADLPRLRPLQWWAAALELRLARAHAGLPAGTVVLIGYAAADRPPAPPPTPAVPTTTTAPTTITTSPVTTVVPSAAPPNPAPAARHAKRTPHVRKRVRRRHAQARVGLPLTVTPPLRHSGYVFPVAAGAAWGDTYGAARSDVPGGWHHGDDLFAPLGTPVVAVADGTVFAVGWNRVGGWRLWLRDRAGNDFYYAHLSGYTRVARNGHAVEQGEVLGFVGNTGDAFTTPPHLHFEVHPSSLLYLGYDGAVDPTAYLRAWTVDRHVHPLPPVQLPGGATPGAGSLTDFRRLLAVRPLARPKIAPKRISALPAVRRHAPEPAHAVVRRAAAAGGRPAGGPLPVVFAVVLLVGALAAIVHAARDGRT